MAQPGANVRLYVDVGGSPVPFSPLPMELVSGKTYKFTAINADKSIWKTPDVYPTYSYMDSKGYSYQDLPFETYADKVPYLFVYDGGTTSSDRVDPANIEYINFLGGRITFKSTYIPTGTIYVSSEYIPFSKLVSVKTATINESADLADITTWGTIDTIGDSRVRMMQLVDRTGSFGGFYEKTNGFEEILKSGDGLYFRLYFDIINHPNTYITCKILLESNDTNFELDNPNSEDTPFKIEMYSEVIE